jgi:hypothetical protein
LIDLPLRPNRDDDPVRLNLIQTQSPYREAVMRENSDLEMGGCMRLSSAHNETSHTRATRANRQDFSCRTRTTGWTKRGVRFITPARCVSRLPTAVGRQRFVQS